MKMKSKYIYLMGASLLCFSHVLRGQSSNSTTGGFMNQINSWISRLRGNNNSNNNNNNNSNNNSDKDKDTQNKGTGQQMNPVQYANAMPYPMMTGMTSMYGPMSPMTMSFAPRPMPSAAFVPAGIPFGSLAAGSNIGPNMGPSIGLAAGSSLASSMASSLASPMASAMNSGISSSYPQMSQLSPMRPSYSSASHMMPVHQDYSDAGNDYQVGGYGVANSFSNNGYSSLNSNNYGNIGSAGPEQQMPDSAYNGENGEQNNGEEYSSSYHR